MLEVLTNDGTVMICGSLSMQKDVLQVLENICNVSRSLSIEDLMAKGKILTDCY